MIQSTRKWKCVICIIFVMYVAYMNNAFAQQRFSLSEKASYQPTGLRDISNSTPRAEENYAVLRYAKSYISCLHKNLPIRIAKDYVTAGQRHVYAAVVLTADAKSDFGANLLGSFNLPIHVVQRE